jgi:hypothetical protein
MTLSEEGDQLVYNKEFKFEFDKLQELTDWTYKYPKILINGQMDF